MPHGKRAGERCVQLLPNLRCAIFGRPERPAVCASLRPLADICGRNRVEALGLLAAMEIASAPAAVVVLN